LQYQDQDQNRDLAPKDQDYHAVLDHLAEDSYKQCTLLIKVM